MCLLWTILASVIYIILVTPTTALVRPKITKLEIESNIRFRLATTNIRMYVNNTEKESKNFNFETLLPNGALVFNVSLIVNGTKFMGHSRRKSKEYKDWLKMSKNTRRKLLKNRTFYDTNMFLMNATLAGQSEAFFNLTYKTVLFRKDSLYSHRIPIFIRQKQVVKQLRVLVSLWEPENINQFTASLIHDKNMPKIANDTVLEEYPRTMWRSRNNILVDYTEKLGKLRNVFSRVFQVQFDLDQVADKVGDVLWHKGRGLYFFRHDINPSLPKDLVFAIDMSSSTFVDWRIKMNEALPIILGRLQPTDRFNVLMYNQTVHGWKNQLQEANNENKENAVQFVKSFSATGIGNIYLALNKSLDYLNDPRPGRFQAVYFFCDGYDPTYPTQPRKIVQPLQHKNKGRNIPIFTLAMGPTADVPLLRAVAASTGGKFSKIYQSQLSHAVEMMLDFFEEINANLLYNLTLRNCDKDAHRFDRSRDYYRGSEVIFYISTDCFHNNSSPMIVVSATGHNGINNFSTPVVDSDLGLPDDKQREEFLKSHLEVLAIRTAIQLDDRKALRAFEGLVLTDRTFIVSRAVDVSSPVANIDKANETSSFPSKIRNTKEIWSQDIHGAGVGDPHFMVELKGLKRPVCFNMMGNPGDVINLLYDKRNGILVNAKIICAEDEEDECEKTYMGIISVAAPSENWTISSEGVQVSRHHSWQNENSGPLRDQFTVQYSDGRSMFMTWKSKEKETIKLLIRKSRTKKKAIETKYLDFYLVDGSGLSNATDGLIGQFTDRRGVVFKVRKTPDGKMKTHIRIHYKNYKPRTFSAVLTGKQRAAYLRRDCWTVWKEGKGFVRGKYKDYVTRGLFEVPIYRQQLKTH